ncbi:aldehyde dehydrogenase family protein [Paraburkholderia youngii]|uniref:aldehyde dehydrogenase family protein n=1 Tax=Paraburkholderia youngii TaxID=2782701 RepID=UPI003D240D7A
MKTYQHWINGAWVSPARAEWLDSVDPYDRKVWARIPRGSSQDADRAVAAAYDAMHHGPWSRMTATERGKILRRRERQAAWPVSDNYLGRSTG